MKVKGSVVSSINKFVKGNFPNRYKDWKAKLPASSQQIYNDVIAATQWYDVQPAAIEPTRLIADMFYDRNAKQAAWESGRHSAEDALTGIYKVFVLISTPAFMMSRAGKILASFYDRAVIKVVENRSKGMTLHITEFPGADQILEHRIAGWIQKALEICGCKEVQIQIPKMISKGQEITEFVIEWR